VRANTSRRVNPFLSNFFSSAMIPPQTSTVQTSDLALRFRLLTENPASGPRTPAIVHLLCDRDSPKTLNFVLSVSCKPECLCELRTSGYGAYSPRTRFSPCPLR
jgi:hypothetical protein